MRFYPLVLTLLLAACGAAEKEVQTTSVNVDQSQVFTLLTSIDAMTDNTLAVDEMLELALSTPMDEEQQNRFPVVYNGADEEILFHVWREQADWLHLYFSSTSKELVAALEKNNEAYAREEES